MALAVRPPGAPSRQTGHATARSLVVLVVAGVLAILGGPARAAAKPVAALEQIARTTGATAMAFRSGDPTPYVALQGGRVVALRAGAAPETVLDLTPLVQSGGERGLLGLAFAPDGRHLYVHYSGQAAGETVVEEYGMVDGRPDPTTRRVLLTVPQPQANHNGGQLAFGPDGMLYLGLGDGGNRDDQGPGHAPGGNAQSRSTLLGKILRIDPRPSGATPYTIPPDNPFVDGAGRPEIEVLGLRNPWRFSFDRRTGDLWIADVGQDQYEEVTRLPAGHIAGANLGWPEYDATHPYRSGPSIDTAMPQIETSHADGNCSVTGGYVYRGARIRSLRGWYVFSDYCNGAIEAAKITPSGTRTRAVGVQLPTISSFGEDDAGELYVLSQSRGVFRVIPG